jgi:hypothetical protein
MADGYHHHSYARPHARDVAPDSSPHQAEAAQAPDGERGIDIGALAQQGIGAWNKLDPATQGKVLNSGKDVAGVFYADVIAHENNKGASNFFGDVIEAVKHNFANTETAPAGGQPSAPTADAQWSSQTNQPAPGNGAGPQYSSGAAPSSSASGDPQWAPQAGRGIHPGAQVDSFEIRDAWYGVQHGTPDQLARTAATRNTVLYKLRANLAATGHITLPPEHHVFFGMDPLPGVVKVTFIEVLNQRTHEKQALFVPAGQPFSFPSSAPADMRSRGLPAISTPDTHAQRALPAGGSASGFDPIDIVDGWYGVEGGSPAQEVATLNTRHVVVEKLRANVGRNGGFIALPPAHHIFFGMDPLPGVVKVTAIRVRNTRTGAQADLRAQGGVPFVYPPNVPGTLATRALQQSL